MSSELVIEFKQNIFCRRESNQHKARRAWGKIRDRIPKRERQLFETEWRHYLMSEFDYCVLASLVEEIEEYLK